MADQQEATFSMRRNDELNRVEFGAVVDGVFHPLSTIASGDFDEAQSAGKQAQQNEQPAEGQVQ